VCVRVRPLLRGEDIACVRPRPDGESMEVVVGKQGERETSRGYTFDRVAGPDTSQAQFFEASGVKNLMDNLLRGLNVSCFVYGQTGSGKTFTMSGNEERLASGHGAATADASSLDFSAGLVPRAVDYLYACLHEEAMQAHAAAARTAGEQGAPLTAAAPRGGVTTKIRAAFLEIYNENIYDLLNMTGDALPLRWNGSLGFFVQGQLVVTCDTAEDVLAVIAEGHANRTVGSHALNLDSSRSHSLLTLLVERSFVDAGTGQAVTTRSKAMFVDLAGSERLKESKSEGVTAVETRQINKSLFALGKVIASLADRKRPPPGGPGSGVALTGGGPDGKGVNVGAATPSGVRASRQSRGGTAASAGGGSGGGGAGGAPADDGGPEALHIPYRDSKLTKLLMDTLGGSALTIMVACVSPAAVFAEETLMTLLFASRARRIENAPVVHMDAKDALIVALKRENRALRGELDALRTALGLPLDLPLGAATTHFGHPSGAPGALDGGGFGHPHALLGPAALLSPGGFSPRWSGVAMFSPAATPSGHSPAAFPPPHHHLAGYPALGPPPQSGGGGVGGSGGGDAGAHMRRADSGMGSAGAGGAGALLASPAVPAGPMPRVGSASGMLPAYGAAGPGLAPSPLHGRSTPLAPLAEAGHAGYGPPHSGGGGGGNAAFAHPHGSPGLSPSGASPPPSNLLSPGSSPAGPEGTLSPSSGLLAADRARVAGAGDEGAQTDGRRSAAKRALPPVHRASSRQQNAAGGAAAPAAGMPRAGAGALASAGSVDSPPAMGERSRSGSMTGPAAPLNPIAAVRRSPLLAPPEPETGVKLSAPPAGRLAAGRSTPTATKPGAPSGKPTAGKPKGAAEPSTAAAAEAVTPTASTVVAPGKQQLPPASDPLSDEDTSAAMQDRLEELEQINTLLELRLLAREQAATGTSRRAGPPAAGAVVSAAGT
jgi:hypothetical protein